MSRIRITSNEKLDGTDPKVFWKKYLQCIPGISSTKAEAVSSAYPTLASLLQAYENCATQNERIELLAVGMHLNGAWSCLVQIRRNFPPNSIISESVRKHSFRRPLLFLVI